MRVDGLGYVYECYVVLDERSSLFVFPVCAYGGAVRYFWCFIFMCEFCFLYCDDVRFTVVYEGFQFLNFRLCSTSQIISPSGQQCCHMGWVCLRIQG